MKVDEKLIEKIGELARINVSSEEAKKFKPQFKEILEAFSKLDEVDVKGVKPSFQPVEIKNVMREDKIEESLPQSKALSNSENTKDGYIKGPKAV